MPTPFLTHQTADALTVLLIMSQKRRVTEMIFKRLSWSSQHQTQSPTWGRPAPQVRLERQFRGNWNSPRKILWNI